MDNKSNNNSKVAGIMIIIVGVVIVTALIGFAYFTYRNNVVNFDPNRRAVATRLFESVINTDLILDYPRTPQEVMRYWLDISRLLQSGMIVNDELYPRLVTQMRYLLDDELLRMNPFEEQLFMVLDTSYIFRQNQIMQTGWTQLTPLFYADDPTVCYVRASQSFNTGETVYWLFRLERVIPQNEWRIARFDRTDEEFNILH